MGGVGDVVGGGETEGVALSLDGGVGEGTGAIAGEGGPRAAVDG